MQLSQVTESTNWSEGLKTMNDEQPTANASQPELSNSETGQQPESPTISEPTGSTPEPEQQQAAPVIEPEQPAAAEPEKIVAACNKPFDASPTNYPGRVTNYCTLPEGHEGACAA